MAAQAFNLTFNCAPAQFAVAMATTLPAVGFNVIQAPNNFAGILVGGAASGANPILTALGKASPFALLAYSGITNTGTTVITGGSIGSTPTATYTGFLPGTVTVDQPDASAAQTALEAAIAYYQGLLLTASAISSVATTVGTTAVYTGVFANGAANGLVGATFLVSGFATHVGNNGTFLATASTGTTLTLSNASAIAEVHVASATQAALANLSTGGNGGTVATYLPGNYFSVAASSLDIPTSITLDAGGNANATFVFVAGSTITLESGASIILANGAQAANVVFVNGTSFTSSGASSTINGNILAHTSISLGGGILNGRALANTGAVTIAAGTTGVVTQPTGTSGAAGLGQIDFFYDGQYYLKFFGAGPIVDVQTAYGMVSTNMSPALISTLSNTLFATLGAPVASNIANVAGPAA